MSGQLLHQWPIKPIADICEIFSDGNWIESKDQSPSGIRLVQTGNIGEGVFKNRKDKARYISEGTYSRLNCTEIFEGDCLISRLPRPVGRACLIPNTGERMITAVDCSILRFKQDLILPQYFVYYSQSAQYGNQIQPLCTGSTRKRISRKNLGRIEIPVPPLEEQQRIVGILDEAFENISNVLEQIVDESKNAEELALSLSNSMVSDLLSMCDCEPLESVAQIINGFAFASTAFSDNEGVKSIKITNVGVQKFVQEKGNYLPNQFSDAHSKVRISTGDIVIALTRTIIDSGLKVAIVPSEYDGALLNQRVAAIRVNQNLIFSDFLYSYLCSNHVKTYVIEHVNTLMQPNLSIRDLRTMPIPKPSLSKQKEVADILTAVALNVKNLKDTYEQKVENIEELKQSILQEAFNGTLRIAEGLAGQS